MPIRQFKWPIKLLDGLGRCGTCPGKVNCVMGDGPRSAKVVFIGEAPGQWENSYKLPFIGDTGSELNNLYLPLAGLDRKDVYITNVVHCQPPGNATPKPKEIAACGNHLLKAELGELNPELVVLLGAVPCSLLDTGRPGGIKLDKHHGEFVTGMLLGRAYECFISYHPAFGLRSGMAMQMLMDDFKKLGRYLQGKRDPLPVQTTVKLKCRLVRTEAEVSKVLHGAGSVRSVTAIDTETQAGKLWSVQWASGQVGKPPKAAYVALTHDHQYGSAITVLRETWEDDAGIFLLHNIEQDLNALAQVGIELPEDRVVDTMRMAYRLHLPQGLKLLAYKLLGVEMRDYQDVVGQASRDAQLDWIIEARQLTKPWKKLKHPLDSILKRLFRCGSDNLEYDLNARLKELRVGELQSLLEALEVQLGGVPVPGIARVPLAEAVEYGGMDAFRTWQVYWKMVGMMKDGRWMVDEEDWDV